MYAVIKNRAAFRTSFLRKAVDYSLILEALSSSTSSVLLDGGDIPRGAADSFLLLGGNVFLISLVSPDQGQTALQLSSPLELFSRPRPYSAPSAGFSVGDFIARELATFRDEPDAAYAMPYLQIKASDSTPFIAPTVDDNGLYVLSDYLRTVFAEQGVEISFEAMGDELCARIRKTSPSNHTLICGDGHTFLETNSYSRTATAKVTTYQPTDSGEVDENGEKIFVTTRTDWFLAADGAVSSQEPAGRAAGEWKTITVSEKDSAQEAAEAVFAQNTETHKVEILTDVRLRVRDDLRLRLPSGEVFEGKVTAVSRRKGDRRWRVQAGTLATTLTDKVRKASSGGGSSSSHGGGSSANGQIYAVGDLYLTTRAGDPAQLLGYGAWDRIQGRFLFAADGSRPVNTRGGAASHTLTAEELPTDASVVDPDGLYCDWQPNPSGTSSAYHVISRDQSIRTKALGAGKGFSLFPPFVSIYVWVRKA